MRFSFLLCLGLLSSLRLVAAPLTFVPHNFSVEIPPGWGAITPQPKDTLLAVENPAKTERFLVYAAKTSLKDHPEAAKEAREAAKKSMEKSGVTFDPDQTTTIDGVPFVTSLGHFAAGGSITIYTGMHADHVYMMRAVATTSGDPNDPQLQSGVQSFHLLSPNPPIAEDPPAKPENPLGRYMPYLASAFVIVVVFRWLTKKKPKAS
jgi:hypothetical protein